MSRTAPGKRNGERKYGTGVILSGGGARGFAHAGMLKALNESDIYPDVVSGTSVGAIVGSLYADGHTPDEIYDLFVKEDNFFEFVKVKLPGKGLFRLDGLRKNLRKNLRAETFGELKIPLFVSATDICSGEIVYFHEGELLDKVLASASIPVLFEPVEIGGSLFVDGGVLDNFPVTPIEGRCETLVGISLNPIQPEKDFSNLFQVAERTFRLSVSSNISPKIELCDLVFEPGKLDAYSLLDPGEGEKMFEIGYNTVKKQMKRS